jgi:nucleoside-diphosphate-sugar epimerase
MVTDGRAVVPFSNEELQRQLARQQWTAHNIRLTPKVTTMPGQPDFMETDTRLHSILRTMRILNNLPIIICEDGEQARDFVFVQEVARAAIFCRCEPSPAMFRQMFSHCW